MKTELDSNFTRMLQAILNKSWRQHLTKQQLYGDLPPITKTIKLRRTRNAGHFWKSRDVFISDILLWTPSHGQAKAGRPAWTYMQQPIRDVASKTCRKQWTVERGSERGSRISVLMARLDDVSLILQPIKVNFRLIVVIVNFLLCYKTLLLPCIYTGLMIYLASNILNFLQKIDLILFIWSVFILYN